MFSILAILCAIIVLGVVWEIIQQRRCLTDAEFSLFQKGNIDNHNKRTRRAIAHLGLCEKCQRKLQEKNFGKGIDEHLVE